MCIRDRTLSVYDFVQKTGAEKVLIVTNRPAIANSWFLDYAKFLGSESGYLFVSEVDELKGKRGVLTREEYTHFLLGKDSENVKCIEFVSLQDMKGSIYFGGQYDKLGEVANMAVSYTHLEPLLRNGIGDRTDAVAMTTKRIAENYTAEIMKKLIAHGYREELVHLYIIGGGGCLLQNFSDLTAKPEVTVITDICANAKGYEALAMMKQRMRG